MQRKTKITTALLLSMLGTFSLSTWVSAETKEVPSLGMKYEITPDMEDAGMQVIETGISTVNPMGELDIVCDNILLGAILVMDESLGDNYQDGKTAEEFLAEAYPDFEVSSDKKNGYVYCNINSTSTIAYDDLDNDTAEHLKSCIPLYEEFLGNITYTEVAPGSIAGTPVTFSVSTLEGDTVTESIFNDKDFTILNVWATYCNPCINEMPDLAAWEKELPENVQILYLCTDIPGEDSAEMENAKTIVEKSGINPKNVLILKPDNFTQIIPYLSSVPTTFFIDKDGKLTEQIIVGASVDNYKETLNQLLQ